MSNYKADISFTKPVIIIVSLALMIFIGVFAYFDFISGNYSESLASLVMILFIVFVGFYWVGHFVKELDIEEDGLKITFLNGRICKYPWKKIWYPKLANLFVPSSIIIKWETVINIYPIAKRNKSFKFELLRYLNKGISAQPVQKINRGRNGEIG